MESTICFLTEWTLKAGGHFQVDSMFLIEKGACTVLPLVVKEVALHSERERVWSLQMPLWMCGSSFW